MGQERALTWAELYNLPLHQWRQLCAAWCQEKIDDLDGGIGDEPAETIRNFLFLAFSWCELIGCDLNALFAEAFESYAAEVQRRKVSEIRGQSGEA